MRRSTALLIAAALALVGASQTFAAHAPPGDINNTASVTYSDDNGNPTTTPSNTVTTTINTVESVAVTANGAVTATAANKVTVRYFVNIENTGNVPDTFALTINQSGIDQWEPGAVTIYEDAGTVGGWDPALDTTVTDTAVALGSEGNYPVVVVFDVPANALDAEDGDQNIFTLTATGNSNDTSGDFTTTIEAPLLTHTLTVDNTTPSPGQTVEFTSTITSVGSLAPGTVDFSATVPAGFTPLAGPTNTTGGDTIGIVGSLISGTYLMSEAGGGATSWVITWTATVDATTSGSVVATATASSLIAGDTISKVGTASAMNIVDVNSVTAEVVAPALTSVAVTPGDDIVFEVTVTNTGNNPDTFDLTHSNTSAWGAYDYYTDAGLTTPFTDTNGGGVSDTGVLAAGGSVVVYLGMTSPTSLAHTDADTLTLTATSIADNTAFDTTGSLSVDVQAPFLTIVKAVLVNGAAAANANPGDTLTYTITVTNTGDGAAANVFISDAVPQYTTYSGNLSGTLDGGTPDTDGTANGDTVLISGLDIYAGKEGAVGDTAFALPVGSVYVLSFDVLVD